MTPDRQTTVTLTALDLAGDWAGSAEGTEISYTFNPDGTMVWRVNDPQFKASAPDGAKGRFRIIKGLRFNEIKLYRFESPELEDHSFRGIIELLDENSFKMEIGQGANPIDFAYRILSDVGNHCVGAKVNGRIVLLTYRFNNGDIVEIISRSNSNPSLDWLSFAKTSNARNRIKRFFRENGSFRLQPENPSLEPIIVDHVTVLGRVVLAIHKF
jgi:hypothetical protein